MEEQEQEPSKQFIDGFNAGYQLSKHDPQLLNNVLASTNDHNEFIKALAFGRKQEQKEKLIEEQKNNLTHKNTHGRKI